MFGSRVLQVAVQFNMPGKVYAIAMSTIATTHMLVAAGTENDIVRLCDLATGAFTHTLSGHRGTFSTSLRRSLMAVLNGYVGRGIFCQIIDNYFV